MSANCRYVVTELFFLACLQRICPALLFQGSQPRPLSTHLFSQLPQAKLPNRFSYWTPICPALHLKTKVIPKLHHKVTEFKPIHTGNLPGHTELLIPKAWSLLALAFTVYAEVPVSISYGCGAY